MLKGIQRKMLPARSAQVRRWQAGMLDAGCWMLENGRCGMLDLVLNVKSTSAEDAACPQRAGLVLAGGDAGERQMLDVGYSMSFES